MSEMSCCDWRQVENLERKGRELIHYHYMNSKSGDFKEVFHVQ